MTKGFFKVVFWKRTSGVVIPISIFYVSSSFFLSDSATDSDIAALEDLLTDRIVYTNQYQLRNQLALVDDVGQVVGVLDTDEVDVEDDDNVSLHENQKLPVVVEAIEPKDDDVR